jgi:hypothetical protein
VSNFGYSTFVTGLAHGEDEVRKVFLLKLRLCNALEYYFGGFTTLEAIKTDNPGSLHAHNTSVPKRPGLAGLHEAGPGRRQARPRILRPGRLGTPHNTVVLIYPVYVYAFQ